MLEAGIYTAPAELGVGEGQASSWQGCLFSKGFLWGSPACLPRTCVLPGPDVPSREPQQQPCLHRQGHGWCRLRPRHAAFSSLQPSQRCSGRAKSPGKRCDAGTVLQPTWTGSSTRHGTAAGLPARVQSTSLVAFPVQEG